MSRKSKPARKDEFPLWRTFGAILGVGVVIALAIAFWPSGGGSEAGSYPTYSEEAIATGEQYFQANCATCHGSDGAGNTQAGIPALNGSMHAWHHPDSQIAGLIRHGGISMPAIGPDWSDEDITAVLAYIKQWWTPEQRAAQAQASRRFPE